MTSQNLLETLETALNRSGQLLLAVLAAMLLIISVAWTDRIDRG